MKLRTSFGVVATASLVLAGTALQGTAIADDGGMTRTVRIEDRCEPTSFNAAIGAGTCVPNEHGDVTFGEFLEELNPADFGDDHWRFSRENFSVEKGERVALTNPGGEAHTFTEVAAFGGGCVEDLNGPLGLTGLDGPACGAAFAGIILPGAKVTLPALSPGQHKFICVIHPWMRSTVTQRG